MRRLLPILLPCLLIGGVLRCVYAVYTPPDLDETHYGIDALWIHPEFPGDRAVFLREHPYPHRVLSRTRWRLVTHAAPDGVAGGWRLQRVGHPMLQAFLLGLWFRPLMRADDPSPGETLERLRLPMRLAMVALDLLLLGALVGFVAARWGSWAGAGAGAFYALAPWLAGSAPMIRPDGLMALLLAGATLLFHHARARSERDRHVLAAGAALGLAVVTKQSAPLLFPLLALGLWGAKRWPLRLVFAGAVALPLAVALCDLSGALHWLGTGGPTSLPPDLMSNAVGFLEPSRWWMLGGGFATTIHTPLAPLTESLAPVVFGLFVGAAVLALSGERKGLAALCLVLAVWPSLGLPHRGAVYRLLPGGWVAALLVGLGLAAWPAASRRRRLLASGLALLVCGVFAFTGLRDARFYSDYRRADAAFTEAFTAGGPPSPALLERGERALDAALAVRPGCCLPLLLRAQVRLAQGRTDEARALVARARRDRWLWTYSPAILPSGARRLLQGFD
jgi:hypothetical protein